jgi:GNAT superfamily N-acetyltransferase
MKINGFNVREIGKNEIEEMTKVHLNAFDNSLLTKLGPKIVSRYYLWQFSEIEKYDKKIFSSGVFLENELVAFTIFGLPRNAKIGFLRSNWHLLFIGVLFNIDKLDLIKFKGVLSNFSYLLKKNIFSKKTKKKSKLNVYSESYGILVTACKKEFEGRGFGTLLMRSAEKIAKMQLAPSIHLSVRAENKSAWKIYEALGYEKVLDSDGNWSSFSMIKNFKK